MIIKGVKLLANKIADKWSFRRHNLTCLQGFHDVPELVFGDEPVAVPVESVEGLARLPLAADRAQPQRHQAQELGEADAAVLVFVHDADQGR